MKKTLALIFTLTIIASSLAAFGGSVKTYSLMTDGGIETTPSETSGLVEGVDILTRGEIVYSISGLNLFVKSCDETALTAEIPNEIEGLKVTSILPGAFANCQLITKIKLPETIKTIGEGAFTACLELVEINIPDGVTSIGSEAFYYCVKLEEIKLPSSLFELDDSLFTGCVALKKVEIPENLTNWTNAMQMFAGCSSLESVKIPEGVKIIPDYMFGGCVSLTEITFPESLEEIGSYSFSGCTNLKNVKFTKNIMEIGVLAFGDCVKIPAFEVDPENEQIAVKDGVLFTKNFEYLLIYPAGKTDEVYDIPGTVTQIAIFCFFNVDKIKEIYIPKSVSVIPSYFASTCHNLEKVVIPKGVTAIKTSAFFDLPKLPSLEIPQSVTEIGLTSMGYLYDAETGKEYIDRNFKIIAEKSKKNPAALDYAKANSITFKVKLSSFNIVSIFVGLVIVLSGIVLLVVFSIRKRTEYKELERLENEKYVSIDSRGDENEDEITFENNKPVSFSHSVTHSLDNDTPHKKYVELQDVED